MRYFEVYQDGAAKAFEVYHGANPTASMRFMVHGSSGETALPSGNDLLTTDMIVDMNFGGRIPQVKRTAPTGRLPISDRRGRKIRWDE